ncbi:TPA: hypothetical protein ACU3EH_001763 [Salmonella enterica]|nr:hypothetical protein [Salmonella enterica subsp. enterica]
MNQNTTFLPKKVRALAFLIMIYIFLYSLLSIKFLIMVWAGNMQFIKLIIGNYDPAMLDGKLPLAACTILGAILGGAILSITSLHRYSAITKSLDFDHIWGYLMAPLLSTIIGSICFCLLLSGIFVLTGNGNTENSTIVISGYTVFGAICGYNWDVFIKKIEELARKMSNNSSKEN